jgi:hypothetical protein
MVEDPKNLGADENGRSGDSGIDGLGSGDGIDGGGIDGGVGAGSGDAPSGDGTLSGDDRGSRADGGDGGSGSGIGAASGLGIDGAAGIVPGGDPGAVGSDRTEPRRKRGRPRKLGIDRGSDNPDNSRGTAADESRAQSDKPDSIRIDQGKPKAVKADTIIDAVGKLPKGSVEAIVAAILQGLFFVPSNMFPGAAGKVWQLKDSEAKELAKAVLECTETLPKKQKAKVDAFLKEWGPWVKLATIGGAIMLPRIEATRAILKEQKENATSNNATGTGRDVGSAAAAGTEWPNTIEHPDSRFGYGPGL